MAKKSGGASLRRVLDSSSAPLFVFDSKRRFAYSNPAFTTWCGYTFDSLADRRADYHSLDEGALEDQFCAAICPPPRAFANETSSGRCATSSASGNELTASIHFLPLGDGDDVVGVLGRVLLGEASANGNVPHRESDTLHAQVARLRRELSDQFRLDRLLGVSPAIELARKRIALAAESRANVVIAGPPGSGREHVARTVYYHGAHDDSGTLVPLSCEILDAELLNTTIDAMVNERGVESLSASALLLLDADQLSDSCQEALLKWLDNASAPPTIATTRLPLTAMSDTFHRELALQLSTIVIELPSLADRKEDIPILAQAFLEDANRLGGPQLGGFAEEAMERLIQHEFNGNAEGLKRLVQQAAMTCRGVQVEVGDLPDEIRWAADQQAHPKREFEAINLDEFLAEIEQELISRALAAAKGNRAQAAKLLGVSRAKLLRRLDSDEA